MKTELKFEYNICEENKESLPVIIVAAGNSTRMGINKQFLQLLGFPVIARTLAAFENSPSVSRIILVVKEEDILSFELLAEKYNITKLTDIVGGGNTRQESVLRGFDCLESTEKKVLIHDGARPLVSQKIITDVVAALENSVAVTCGVKVKDTIKQVDKNGKIIKTLNRDSLLSVQTPQGVSKDEYLSAVNSIGSVAALTDDMSVMEAAGYECYFVEGSYKNIKITTLEDISLAENYLKEEDL